MEQIKKTKILNLISTLDRGGAETFLYRLTTKMDASVFESRVVTMTGIGSIGKDLQESRIPVYSLGMPKGLPDPRGLVRLIQLIRHYQPDILHCWMYHAFLLGIAVKFFFPKIKVIWNIRCSNMEFGKYGVIYDFTVRTAALLSPLTDCLIANSFAGKKYHFHLGYRNNNWNVIQNGIDTEVFHPAPKNMALRRELGIPEDAFVIVHVARFDPMKGHRTFFEAVELYLEKNENTHFIFAGKGMDNRNLSILRYICDIEKKNHVHLLGERKDINRIYAAADIAASSSYGEGFPNVIAEAMATGLPCVATDAGDSAIIIGDSGVVVPINNTQKLVQAWNGMAEKDTKTFKMLGKRALSRIQEKFNLAHVVKEYELFLSSYSLLDKKS